jgi:hypothetical protein
LSLAEKTKKELEETRQSTKALQEQVRYWKGKYESSTNTSLYSRKVHELKEELDFWPTRCISYEEQMEEFISQRDIVTFKDGRYQDHVRQLYMELMCLKVGSRNVEKIIR